jgi:hypothetical protein
MNDISVALRELANKAIRRVAYMGEMTELMPEDVRLLERAAMALDAQTVRAEIERAGAQ